MMYARWGLAAAFFLFGLAAVGNWTSPKWIILTLGLYSLPVLAQLAPSQAIRANGLWIGVFLVLQTLITPLVIDRDYKTLPPNLDQRIDVRGYAIPGISGLQSITTDEKGFRVTKDVDYEDKPKGTYRIFALGGSTTEQILLDDRSTWTHRVQEFLEDSGAFGNVEVVNAGVSGTRAEHHLATLRRVVEWEPDAVLFLVGINDWNRAIWDEFGAPTRDNPGVPQSPIQFSDTILGRTLAGALAGPSPSVDDDSVKPEFGEYYSSQNDSLTREPVREFRPDAVAEDYAAVLERIADTCIAYGVDCVLLSQPTAYSEDASPEMRAHFWMTPPNTDYTLDLASMSAVASLYNNHLMGLAARRGLSSCDIAARLEPTLDVFYDDCHFNTNGAERVAGTLLACLLEERLGTAAD